MAVRKLKLNESSRSDISVKDFISIFPTDTQICLFYFDPKNYYNDDRDFVTIYKGQIYQYRRNIKPDDLDLLDAKDFGAYIENNTLNISIG